MYCHRAVATATFPCGSQHRYLPLHRMAPCHLLLRLHPQAAHPLHCKLHSSAPAHPLGLLRSMSTTGQPRRSPELVLPTPLSSHPCARPCPWAARGSCRCCHCSGGSSSLAAAELKLPFLLHFQTASQLPGELLPNLPSQARGPENH